MWRSFVLPAFTVMFSGVGVGLCWYLHALSIRDVASAISPSWHRKLVLDLRKTSVWYLWCAIGGAVTFATIRLFRGHNNWPIAVSALITLVTWVYLRRKTAWAVRQRSFRRIPSLHDEGMPVA